MSGRWVVAMKTPTVWRSKYTARGYEEPQSDEGCFAATATVQGIRMLLARCLDKRDLGHEAFVADYTQAFLNAEVREGEQLYVQPLEGWSPPSRRPMRSPLKIPCATPAWGAWSLWTMSHPSHFLAWLVLLWLWLLLVVAGLASPV